MSKLIKKTELTFLVLLLIIFTACSLNESLPEKKPSDFGFILNYGVGAKNQLDTLNGTYTKDMIVEPEITTILKLSDEDLNRIYSDMRSIDILSYPNTFTFKSNMEQTPFITYSIKIKYDGNEKNIYWADKNGDESEKAVQLRELFNKIRKILSEKAEYKKLPEPKGGYL